MDDQSPELVEAVEVSDLREPSAATSSGALNTRPLLLTPRQRMRRRSVAVSSVVLALLILIVAVPSLRTGAGSWLATFVPTPTATLSPGADRFYFVASILDIQLSIDGRSVSYLPRIGSDPPITLARGQHRISWNVAPFLPQSCLLSVPHGPNDTCGYPISVLAPLRQAPVVASILLLRESLVTLPDKQRSAVVAAIQRGLASSTSAIQPGDHYALAQVATQPLQGALDLQFDTANAFATGDACALSSQPVDAPPYIACNFTSNPCVACAIPTPVLESAGVAVAPSSWYVMTFATLFYTISTLSGHTLIATGPISPGGLAVANFAILVALTWDGAAWRAQPFLGPPYQAPLQQVNASAGSSTRLLLPSPILTGVGCAAMADFIGPNAAISHYRSVAFVSSQNPADGCLAIVTVGASSGARKAYYLYRFGGLVAVNDVAQRQQSFWPAASAHERRIAATILSSGVPAP